MARRTIPAKKGKPFQYPKIEVVNPGGGLNSLVSDNLIDDKEASDLLNIKFVEAGAPAKIDGKSAWGTGLSNTPKGLGTFITDANNRYAVTIDGTALKYTAAPTDAWTSVTGATFTTGKDVTFTSAKTVSGSTGKSAIFIWNGTDGGSYWDGASTSSLTRPGTMPSASFSIFYMGIHFAAGTATNPSRLYLSDPIDATNFTNNAAAYNATGKYDNAHAYAVNDTVDYAGGVYLCVSASTGNVPTNTSFWVQIDSSITVLPNNSTDVPGATSFTNASAANIIDINPRDGDKITALARFKDVLMVFKERSIYQLSIDNTGRPTITPVLNYLGAVSHKSVDNVANDVYYLSRLGWFTLGYQENFYNLIRSNELSIKIHPIIQTINPTNLGRVASLYRPYMFYSSYPTGSSSTNNQAVVYDTRYSAWSKTNIYNASAFTVLVDSINKEHLLFADDATSQVWEIIQDQYADNGAAIPAHWTSKAFDGKEPTLYKRWILLDLLFRQISGTIVITVYGDNSVVVGQTTLSSVVVSNGGIAATGAIGTEMFGGNASTNTVGDPYPNGTGATGAPASTDIPYRLKLIGVVSRTLKVKVESDNINETFVLLGVKLHFQPYSIFKFPSAQKLQPGVINVPSNALTTESGDPIIT